MYRSSGNSLDNLDSSDCFLGLRCFCDRFDNTNSIIWFYYVHIKNRQNCFISVKTKDRQRKKTDYNLFEITNLNFRHTFGFLVRIRKSTMFLFRGFVHEVAVWDLKSTMSSLNKSIRMEKRETALFLSSSYCIFSFHAVKKNPITIFLLSVSMWFFFARFSTNSNKKSQFFWIYPFEWSLRLVQISFIHFLDYFSSFRNDKCFYEMVLVCQRLFYNYFVDSCVLHNLTNLILLIIFHPTLNNRNMCACSVLFP